MRKLREFFRKLFLLRKAKPKHNQYKIIAGYLSIEYIRAGEKIMLEIQQRSTQVAK